MEPVAPQRPALAPLRGQRVGRGGGRQRGVERGVEAGDVRARPGSARRTASSAASDFGWCSGARSVELLERRRTRVVDQHRRREPRAAVHHPVADGVEPVPATRGRRSSCSVGAVADRRQVVLLDQPVARRRAARSLRLLDPALTTSSRPPLTGRRPDPVADLRPRPRRSRACTARAADAAILHAAGARSPPARPRPGTRSITSIDEVEPVEVVEHDHVERRGGGALLLVAAHVEVGVVVRR